MSFICQYIAVDDATLDYLVELDNTSLLAMLSEISVDKDVPKYEIGKLWDGLHFMLTGLPASLAAENNPLSEAIVGVHVFNDDDEDADFVGCIESDELEQIVDALKRIDIDALAASFDTDDYREKKIRPNIWKKDDEAILFKALTAELNNLTAFYDAASQNGWNIVVFIK